MKNFLVLAVLWVLSGVVAFYNPILSAGLLGLGYVWGTIGASTTGTFNFQQIPMFIEFTATTVPTLFQIEVNGEGMIFNLDGNGLTGMTHIRHQNRTTNTYIFQLANGLINGKNGIVTIANAVAGTLTINAWSPILKGNTYNVFGRLSALAAQVLPLKKFSYASFYSAASTDRFAISYNDGSTDNVGRDEVARMLGYTQGYFPTNPYNIDNISPARVNDVQFLPTAAQTVYAMRYAAAFGGSPSNLKFI